MYYNAKVIKKNKKGETNMQNENLKQIVSIRLSKELSDQFDTLSKDASKQISRSKFIRNLIQEAFEKMSIEEAVQWQERN